MNKSKIIQMVVLLAAIVIIAGTLIRTMRFGSMSLSDYERLNTSSTEENVSTESVEEQLASSNESPSTEASEAQESSEGDIAAVSQLTGALLNQEAAESRVTYSEGFYYEAISDNLRRYITGISYPSAEDVGNPAVSIEELRYVHIWHYDFNGNPIEGELICNESIAQDLLEIFYQLYRSEYQLEKVRLIDEYDGDDEVSMTDNNTSCFNYRVVAGTSNLSKHALGLAVDINPLYNPYVTYGENGEQNIAPANAEAYANRSSAFPYKIDEDDYCYKLFTEYGFTWGGNWNSSKDYQHFQKSK